MPERLTFFNYWVMTMSLVSLGISLVALIISFVNARRTNAAILRTLEVRGYSQASRPNFESLSHRLAVYLRNLGVPLHDVKLKLVLGAGDGSGTLSIELVRYAIDTYQLLEGRAELAKGMVGLFEVRSDRFPAGFDESIRRHNDGKKYFEIYDCGYLVQSIRIGGWRDRLGAKWNWFAHSINSRLDRKITAKDGHEMIKPGSLIPRMRNWNAAVNYFIKEHDQGAHPNEKGHGANPGNPA